MPYAIPYIYIYIFFFFFWEKLYKLIIYTIYNRILLFELYFYVVQKYS